MSTRVVLGVLPFMLSGMLSLGAISVRAEEAAPEDPPNLKKMTELTKKALEERSSKAKGAGDVAFPFGHYLSAAPVSTKAGPAQPKAVQQPAGMPEFTVSGKMKMGRQVKLFIGRGSYGVGDTVEGARIVEIKDDVAVFDFGGTQYTKPIP
ncbi:MAG: hypothetical protein HYY25_07445 [Candidatus Wallbacteria bacterium]|nr:hypothetical protein [Candidatus Wallbacteria bacterium]